MSVKIRRGERYTKKGSEFSLKQNTEKLLEILL